MIEYRKARVEDVQGIIKVCSDGYRNTYPGLLPQQYIESTIKEFYNEDRVRNEILNINQEWNGWFVASDNGEILGAGGGGFTGKETAELFVIYLNPNRKREGIGTELLSIITNNQIERGAKEQWVSVAKDNFMGIPFYEAVGFIYQDERPSYGLPVNEDFTSIRYKRELASSLVKK